MEKKPFSERHPKLNLMLGFALIIGFVLIGFFISKFIFNIAVVGITKLATLVSSLDAVIIVALITGAVSITGVIISSIIAKVYDYRKSRKEYLTQKRENPYGEFVEMYYKIHENAKKPGSYSEKEMTEDLMKFSRQITLWGSPKVIDKWIQFRQNGADPQKAQDNIFLMEEILNSMRKDLGVKRVKKGNILGLTINDIESALKKK